MAVTIIHFGINITFTSFKGYHAHFYLNAHISKLILYNATVYVVSTSILRGCIFKDVLPISLHIKPRNLSYTTSGYWQIVRLCDLGKVTITTRASVYSCIKDLSLPSSFFLCLSESQILNNAPGAFKSWNKIFWEQPEKCPYYFSSTWYLSPSLIHKPQEQVLCCIQPPTNIVSNTVLLFD